MIIVNILTGVTFFIQAKEQLKQAIDDFSRERITLAATAISTEASSKIDNNDVILIYSW